MDIKTLIGRKVIQDGFRGNGEGTIVAIEGDIISIDFDGVVKKFSMEIFIKGLTFDNDKTRELMEQAIDEAKAEKAAVEAAKKAAEEAEKSVADAAAKRAKIVGGFDAGYHAEHLDTDEVYTYQQVEAKFGIRIAGFGRGCNPTDDSVVLISSVSQSGEHFVYHDKWDTNGDYIFSGEGRIGDQKLTARNKEIIDAEKNGKVLHLIIKFSPEEYYYQGIFKLVDYTYEDDLDEDGNTRKEYKFRIRKV